MSSAGTLLLATAVYAACCMPCGAPPPNTPPQPSAPKYRVVAVQVAGLYNEDGTGFFPRILELIGQKIGQDLTKDVKMAPSFEEAVSSLGKDCHIFAGAVEKDGIYANRINFTVPFFEMHIVSAFNYQLTSQQQDLLSVSALNFTGMPETIAAKPDAVKKLPPAQKNQVSKGKADKVVDLDKALKDVQDGKSIFIGRTPVLDNKLLGHTKLQDVKLECQSKVHSSFGTVNDANLLDTLNEVIKQLQQDGSLQAAYTAIFPASLYVEPLVSDFGGSGGIGSSGGEGSGSGSSDDNCSRFAGYRFTGQDIGSESNSNAESR